MRWLRDQGLAVGVLTRNGLSAVVRALRRFTALTVDDFDVVVTRDDGHLAPKPAPDGVLHAAAAMGATPEETLVVGDFLLDMRAGRAAGAVTAYLVNHGAPGDGEAAAPDDADCDFVVGRLLRARGRGPARPAAAAGQAAQRSAGRVSRRHRRRRPGPHRRSGRGRGRGRRRRGRRGGARRARRPHHAGRRGHRPGRRPRQRQRHRDGRRRPALAAGDGAAALGHHAVPGARAAAGPGGRGRRRRRDARRRSHRGHGRGDQAGRLPHRAGHGRPRRAQGQALGAHGRSRAAHQGAGDGGRCAARRRTRRAPPRPRHDRRGAGRLPRPAGAGEHPPGGAHRPRLRRRAGAARRHGGRARRGAARAGRGDGPRRARAPSTASPSRRRRGACATCWAPTRWGSSPPAACSCAAIRRRPPGCSPRSRRPGSRPPTSASSPPRAPTSPRCERGRPAPWPHFATDEAARLLAERAEDPEAG